MDTGAEIDLTPRRDFFRRLLPLEKPILIRGAFGEPVVARFYGDAYIPVDEGVYLVVPEMVLCESLRDTLLSMVKLIKRGHRVNVDAAKGSGVFIDRSDEFTIPITIKENIFAFDFQQHEVNVTTRARFRSEHRPTATAAASSPEVIVATPTSSAVPDPSSVPVSSQLAHDRYGHLCGRKLDQLIDAKGADGMITMQKHRSHKSLISKCDACMLAKAKRVPFGVEMNHGASAPNDKVVGDMIGPISLSKLNTAGDEEIDKFYISMLTDVWSRQTTAQIMSEKKPSDHVISYMHRSKIATGRDLKHFHTDGGAEYNRAERVLESRGIKVTRTPIHTPQWNAIAERKNRTIIECARALLFRASLEPDQFWSYAVETAVFLHNRVIIVNPQGKTAHELFTGQKPDLSLLRVFGCKAIVHSTEEHPSKFAPRGQMGIFVGYDTKRELCYRILVGDKIIVSRDVQFDEAHFPAANKENAPGDRNLKAKIDHCFLGTAAAPTDSDADDDNGTNARESSSMSDSDEEKIDARTLRKIAAREKITKKTEAEPSTRRSGRERTAARQTGLNPDDFGRITFAVSSEPAATPAGRIRAIDVTVPGTLSAALKSSFAPQWKAAMDKEMLSIIAHETFQVVDLPDAHTNVVSSKWVFALKQENGWVTRFKARLVARGFTQQHGVDFEETYSSVARLKTVRCFLAIVAIRDLELELMDVETAYLNAPLKERVYMKQPQGYHRGAENSVWLLKKALYGLRQSGREWHLHIDQFIMSLGFKRCQSDQCVYIKTSRSGNPILILLYVDDIPSAFAEQDRLEWEEIKRAFGDKYKIKFLGEADWFLGMSIMRDRKAKLLWLHQKSYAETVLEEFGMEECRGVGSPGAQVDLTKQQCPSTQEEIAKMRKIPYRQAVGSLMYLANCTRPDLAHAVQLVAQFAQNPGAEHWRAVVQILRYLSSTTHYGLQFGRTASQAPLPNSSAATDSALSNNSALTVFADANWGSCKDSRRSTTGWLIQLCGGWIDWACKKQETVALSSCEAEYVAASAATAGVTWIVQLLSEIGFLEWISGGGQLSAIPVLFSDNRSAIAMANTDSLHSRSKHIDIKHHFIREQVDRKFITLQWISTHEQIADILTKTLTPKLFVKFRDAIVTPLSQGQGRPQQQQAAAAASASSIPLPDQESDPAMLDIPAVVI